MASKTRLVHENRHHMPHNHAFAKSRHVLHQRIRMLFTCAVLSASAAYISWVMVRELSPLTQVIVPTMVFLMSMIVSGFGII